MREIQDLTLSLSRGNASLRAAIDALFSPFSAFLNELVPGVLVTRSAFQVSLVPLGAMNYGRDAVVDALAQAGKSFQCKRRSGDRNVQIPVMGHSNYIILRGRAIGTASRELMLRHDAFFDGSQRLMLSRHLAMDTRPGERENVLHLDWILAAVCRVLRTAQILHAATGSPPGEYAVESRVGSWQHSVPIVVSDWYRASIAGNNLLTLPLLSYVSDDEPADIVGAIQADLLNAIGAEDSDPIVSLNLA